MASTCSIPCSRCNRMFKTSNSLKKHFLDRHQSTQWASSITFYDNDNREVLIPAFEVATDVNHGYKLWLSSLSERMLEALHPVLPGRWVKITDGAVPKEIVRMFLRRLSERQMDMVPHGVKFMEHRHNPYRRRTMKISYKFYHLDTISDVLGEGSVPLSSKSTFSGNNAVENGPRLSMAERIQQTLDDGTLGYRANLEKQHPTSTSTIMCKEKEGRATREIEVIWWPDLFPRSQCEKLEIRFHIVKNNL